MTATRSNAMKQLGLGLGLWMARRQLMAAQG
jgi:hypothetical protein